MAKKQFYAVRVGRKPGIYPNWELCRLQVDGFPRAVFKGFFYEDDALRFMEDGKTSDFVGEPIKRKKKKYLHPKPRKNRRQQNPNHNSNAAGIENFYRGDTPPWEYPTFIMSYIDLLRAEIKQQTDIMDELKSLQPVLTPSR